MGLITKEVETTPSGKSIQYYRDRGYDAKWHEPIMVKVEDLPLKSDIIVLVQCDYCKEEIKPVKYKDYIRSMKNVDKYSCSNCQGLKVKEVMQTLYGVDNYAQTEDFKDKFKKTCVNKYGVKHHMKVESVMKQREATCLEKYNVKNYSSTEECRKKVRETNIERYGYSCSLQNPENRKKWNKSLCDKDKQATSKQQSYICRLYNGILNFPIEYYSADICFPEEKIDFEYDGGFHNGKVKLGLLTQDEFNKKELIRDLVIKREGYKIIRLISRKDYLPSDEILLQLLSHSKEYFSTTSHTWITWDIDNSKMINAENKDTDGVFFDYGKLRRIKKSDILEGSESSCA